MLKMAFWISVVVIALPFVTGGGAGMPEDYDAEPVKLAEMASMVRTTASDVMHLCEREPDACDTGQRIMWNTRIMAGDLAGRAQEWLTKGGEDGDGGNAADRGN